MKNLYCIIILCSSFFIQGCVLDTLNSDEEKVVGNITLINPHLKDREGYYLTHFTGTYNDNLIREKIETLFGNDSVLLVKTSDTTGGRYFKVLHNKGDDPIKVEELDSGIKIYTFYSKTLEHKYSFEYKK